MHAEVFCYDYLETIFRENHINILVIRQCFWQKLSENKKMQKQRICWSNSLHF